MSFKILIVDNKTGKTVADYAEALGIMGAILLDDCTKALCGVHSDMLHHAALLETTQKLLEDVQMEHPELVLAGKFLGELVEKDKGAKS